EARKEFEQCARHVPLVDHDVDETAGFLLHAERGHSEHTKPDQREADRKRENSSDEFTNGAPTGNASDEDTHEWCPRDGPGPVEDGPSTLPAGVLLEGIVPQRQARQLNDVRAD